MRDRPLSMNADPLSDVLELLQARCGFSGRLVAGGRWSRRFANLNAIKFCAAVQGEAWCFMEGMGEPSRFSAGDVLVMNGTRALVLASDPALIGDAPAVPLRKDGEDRLYRLGGGEDFVMLGGSVLIDERRQPWLLSGLPPLLQVTGTAPEAAALGWLLEEIVREMTPAPKPGREIILQTLAQLLFVKTLRAYLAHAPGSDSGWLKGLGDRRLATVLARMHAEPARDWGLADLAQVAGMSRTVFAHRFRQVMGMPPLAYLTHWRMHLAERDLRAGASVAQAAEAVGYRSESAFGHTFKRVMGLAPGQCRKASPEVAGAQARPPGQVPRGRSTSA